MTKNNKIKVPTHLSPKMKQFYKHVCEQYNLENHHLIILTKACESLDRCEEARKQLETDGLTTIDRYGTVKIHPLCKLELDSKNSARLLLRELGLDLEPASEPGRPPRLY